ncbi:MAG: hypothetical protein A2297_04875 [Elusimicrobia bacterium RIFOXYB2_FULL_48_7]|nr:MAG: hypothetical protein A2297_04875 [Elusimicrobia bacterium RIFOXYB2_FULL_48_7]
MQRYNKLFVLFFGFTAMLGLSGMLGGCGSKAAGGKKQVVLRYSNAEGANQIKNMQEICRAFEAENPDIKIAATFGTSKQKILIESAAETPPDIFMWWSGITDLKIRGALLELDEYIKKHNVNMGDYYKGMIDFYTYDGKLYGMPLQLNTYVVVYNKDVFDREKMAYPKPDWTWQDYYDISKKLTKDTNGDGRRDQFGSMYIGAKVFLDMNNWPIIDFKAKKIMLDTKTNRSVIEFLTKLRNEGCPTRAESAAFATSSGGGLQPFLTGKVAMTPSAAWTLSSYAHIKNFKWDIVPMPKSMVTGKKMEVFDEACLVISAKTKYPDEAFRFVKFYCGEKGMKIFAAGKNGIPAYKKAAQTDFLVGLPEHAKYFLDAADITRISLNDRDPLYLRFMEKFNKYFDLYFMDNRSLDETIKNTVRDTEILFKESK